MLKLASIRKSVLAYSADGPADNHLLQLTLFLYGKVTKHMIKTILILIFLSNPILVSGQIKNHLTQNDLEIQKLNGPVKELIAEKFRVKHTTDSTYILEDYNVLEWEGQKFKFNENGYKTEHLLFDLRENSSLDTLKWIFHYDSKNRKNKKLFIKYSQPADTSSTTYLYPNDTLVIEKNKKLEIRHILIENQEIVKSLSKDGYKTRRLYQFDDFNRLIRYENYEDKDYIQQLHVYIYKDTLTSKVYKQINIWPEYGNSNSYTEREYDGQGNPIKIYSGRFENEVVLEFQIKYDYDAYGNWVRMEYYNQNNRLSEVRKRSISYYQK